MCPHTTCVRIASIYVSSYCVEALYMYPHTACVRTLYTLYAVCIQSHPSGDYIYSIGGMQIEHICGMLYMHTAYRVYIVYTLYAVCIQSDPSGETTPAYGPTIYVFFFSYLCVRILLYVSSHYYICVV